MKPENANLCQLRFESRTDRHIRHVLGVLWPDSLRIFARVRSVFKAQRPPVNALLLTSADFPSGPQPTCAGAIGQSHDQQISGRTFAFLMTLIRNRAPAGRTLRLVTNQFALFEGLYCDAEKQEKLMLHYTVVRIFLSDGGFRPLTKSYNGASRY
jgi:hypothetical protein